MIHYGLIAVSVSLLVSFGQAALQPDPPIKCSSCDEWNLPLEPFKLYGNTYYVGTAGLSALLVTSDQGHILLDGGLTQSAPLIAANIVKLGFKVEDIKLILNSHAHYDHAAGIAALQRASGATVVSSASGAEAFALGNAVPDDPQAGFGKAENAFPPVKNVRVVKDLEIVRVGPLAVQMHNTAGHTPGSTTWTWQSCEPSPKPQAPSPACLNMVYADSISAIAAPGFRFTGDAKTPSRVEQFRKSITTVGELPCDIVVTTHPMATDLAGKLKKRAAKPAVDPFIEPQACRVLAANAMKALDARVAEEAKQK
ncbi:MAG: subclass B3 metallo-beta-lactamase [Gammaproteobacteria bacterium]|nr:subclass B3 metallo-beta-lactamase [Gammaproteobacteria bacterium]